MHRPPMARVQNMDRWSTRLWLCSVDSASSNFDLVPRRAAYTAKVFCGTDTIRLRRRRLLLHRLASGLASRGHAVATTSVILAHFPDAVLRRFGRSGSPPFTCTVEMGSNPTEGTQRPHGRPRNHPA